MRKAAPFMLSAVALAMLGAGLWSAPFFSQPILALAAVVFFAGVGICAGEGIRNLKKDPYSLETLREVHLSESGTDEIADDAEVLCPHCGEEYESRLPVCPRCRRRG